MQSVAEYFGLADASGLGWAHRVNTPARLAAAASDAAVHMLEADVQFGLGDATPLVADGESPTELDLVTFVTAATLAGKGVKLDFHSAASVEPSLAILRFLKPETPLVLHADIFRLLSATRREDSLEPEQFIRLCQTSCPRAVLSLGWSLRRTHDADGRVEDALIHQVSSMLMERLGPVAYGIEIRAGYTSGWERGAAFILDPLEPLPAPASHSAPNIIDLTSRLRRVA